MREIWRTSEHDEAVVLCEWLDSRGVVYFHVPNEGRRSYRAGRRLKAEGLKAGVPDYVILSQPRFSDKRIAPVFIELKRPGGRMTRAQLGWLTWLNTNGYIGMRGQGADHAIQFLKSCGY